MSRMMTKTKLFAVGDKVKTHHLQKLQEPAWNYKSDLSKPEALTVSPNTSSPRCNR